MKHRTIFVPMLMPKLSDQAATHLIDILEQLLGIAQHHYAATRFTAGAAVKVEPTCACTRQPRHCSATSPSDQLVPPCVTARVSPGRFHCACRFASPRHCLHRGEPVRQTGRRPSQISLTNRRWDYLNDNTPAATLRTAPRLHSD